MFLRNRRVCVSPPTKDVSNSNGRGLAGLEAFGTRMRPFPGQPFPLSPFSALLSYSIFVVTYTLFDPQNTPECNYDGGDCCSCTCEKARDNDYVCSGVDCKDPDAACFGEESNMDRYIDDDASVSYEFTAWDDDLPIAAADAGEESSGLRVELPARSLFLGAALGFLFPLWACTSAPTM